MPKSMEPEVWIFEGWLVITRSISDFESAVIRVGAADVQQILRLHYSL